MVSKTKTGVSRDQLQRASHQAADDLRVEVVDGVLVESERRVTLLHTIIIQNLYFYLRTYLSRNPLGFVFIDGARYLLEADDEHIARARVPDLSFVRRERVPADLDWRGDFPGAPDFVLEVASPGQGSVQLLGKIALFFDNGCEEAWLVYPWRNQLFQYRRDQDAPHIYELRDVIDTAALFPDFEVTLAMLMNTAQP